MSYDFFKNQFKKLFWNYSFDRSESDVSCEDSEDETRLDIIMTTDPIDPSSEMDIDKSQTEEEKIALPKNLDIFDR